MIPAVVGRITLVVGALTLYALLYTVCDLKAAEMNVERGVMRKYTFYVFEFGYNAAEATKNISRNCTLE